MKQNMNVISQFSEPLKNTFLKLDLPHSGGPDPGKEYLQSGVAKLDNFFGKGLPLNSLIEIGNSKIHPGREVILPYLAQGSIETFILWINSHEEIMINPPAFFSKGVDPSKIVFTKSTKPLSELKAAIEHALFGIIIVDGAYLTSTDCMYLKKIAKEKKKLIILIQPFFLSNKRGNVWSKIRFNINYSSKQDCYFIYLIKGSFSLNFNIHPSELLK